MNRTIRLTESDIHRIVKETLSRILNESEDNYQLLKGNFATITYLQLFDYMDFPDRFPYVVNYGNEVYFFPNSNSYQHFGNQNWKTKGFKTYKECLDFCKENGLEILKTYDVKHSLANGLPDVKSIKPYSHPKDF